VRPFIKLAILGVVLAAPLFAQDEHREPAPAAESTPGDIAVGYSYLNLGFSGKPAVHLNGVEASGTISLNPSWAATLDASYQRAGRDPATGHSSAALSVFAGPVFNVAQKRNMRFLARALVGMSLVDGSVPAGPVYFRGYESRFSWAIGGGVERALSSSYAVRFNVDYLRTQFMGSNATVQPQNGIRLGANFVFRLSPRRGSHHIDSDQN